MTKRSNTYKIVREMNEGCNYLRSVTIKIYSVHRFKKWRITPDALKKISLRNQKRFSLFSFNHSLISCSNFKISFFHKTTPEVSSESLFVQGTVTIKFAILVSREIFKNFAPAKK